MPAAASPARTLSIDARTLPSMTGQWRACHCVKVMSPSGMRFASVSALGQLDDLFLALLLPRRGLRLPVSMPALPASKNWRFQFAMLE